MCSFPSLSNMKYLLLLFLIGMTAATVAADECRSFNDCTDPCPNSNEFAICQYVSGKNQCVCVLIYGKKEIEKNGSSKISPSEENESSQDSRFLPASPRTNHKHLACKDDKNDQKLKKFRKDESTSILKHDYSNDRPEHFYHFYGKDSPFSNFHPARFTLDGIAYSCSEQYMMYQKAVLFDDEIQAKEILKATDPLTMKMLGRKVKNFDDDVWTKRCVEIVKTGVLAKFKQNQHLEKALIGTYPRILAEATPRSPLWGIGLGLKDPQINSRRSWRGKNWLGYLLTEVRNQIMEERDLFS